MSSIEMFFALKEPASRSYASCEQVHGNQVALITGPTFVEQCDGLLTNQEDIWLLIRHADCQACIMYDPVCHVVANVHCGWRGNVQNIYSITIKKMHVHFGCDPKNVYVYISPSLGPCHGEFQNYQVEFPEHFYPFQVKSKYFDLWAISKWQLTSMGVLEKNIHIEKKCTVCDPYYYSSYRREHNQKRDYTMVRLKKYHD